MLLGLGMLALSSTFQSIFDEMMVDFGMSMDISSLIAVAGGVMIALGAVFLFLGIKFCSRNPNKGIAIALLVIYIIGALSILTDPMLGVLPLILAILLVVYLVKLGKQDAPAQTQPQPTQTPTLM